MAAKRVPLYPASGKAKKATGAFYQAYMNLRFFWILKAGHMVRKYFTILYIKEVKYAILYM